MNKEIIQKYFNVVVEGLRKQGWNLHDRGDTPEEMEAEFRKFALEKGLSWPEEPLTT